MTDTTKIKMKIGEHEFDADGPVDIVKEQFAAFRDLVATLAATSTQRHDAPPSGNQKPGQNGMDLDKIMRHDQRIVSLTVRGESIEDEILLVLLGQRQFRQNDSVTGSEILEGLRQTRGNVNRVDYQLTQMANEGDVISVGVRRARRYRLTNQGVTHATTIATALIGTVA